MSGRRAVAATAGSLQQGGALLYKEGLLAWRSRAQWVSFLCLGSVVVLLLAFAAGPEPQALAHLAPGFFWLALLFSSTLTLGEAMRSEYDQQAMQALLLLPVPAWRLFVGKALGHTLLLGGLAAVLGTLCGGLYGVSVAHPAGGGGLLLVGLLGAAAISAPGTLYAALAAQARSQEVILPLLLFPLLVPPLLAAIKATLLLCHGDPFGELYPWLQLLGGFDLLYWVLCGGLFGRVVDA